MSCFETKPQKRGGRGDSGDTKDETRSQQILFIETPTEEF